MQRAAGSRVVRTSCASYRGASLDQRAVGVAASAVGQRASPSSFGATAACAPAVACAVPLSFSRTRWYTPPPEAPFPKISDRTPWQPALMDDNEEDEEEGEEVSYQMSGHHLDLEGYFSFPLETELKYQETVLLGRHSNVTTAGKIQSFSSLVMVGNGDGTGAIGYGKAGDAGAATVHATRDAYKHLVTINRYENRTIPYDITIKYRASKIFLRTLPVSSGLRGHKVLRQFAAFLGLRDMSIKTHGSRNLRNLLHGMLYGLQKEIRDPEIVARGLGLQYVNMNKVWRPKVEPHKVVKSVGRAGFYSSDSQEFVGKRPDYRGRGFDTFQVQREEEDIGAPMKGKYWVMNEPLSEVMKQPVINLDDHKGDAEDDDEVPQVTIHKH